MRCAPTLEQKNLSTAKLKQAHTHNAHPTQLTMLKFLAKKCSFNCRSQGYGKPVSSSLLQLNILEVRANSGFYRVLLNLMGMRVATGSHPAVRGTLYSWPSCTQGVWGIQVGSSRVYTHHYVGNCSTFCKENLFCNLGSGFVDNGDDNKKGQRSETISLNQGLVYQSNVKQLSDNSLVV